MRRIFSTCLYPSLPLALLLAAGCATKPAKDAAPAKAEGTHAEQPQKKDPQAWKKEAEKAGGPFLEVTLSGGASPDTENLRATVEIKNTGTAPAEVKTRWRRNGSEDQVDASVKIEGGATTTDTLEFPRFEGETVIEFLAGGEIAERKGADQSIRGNFVMQGLRFYGQQMTATPPVVDGKLDDWNDPPVVKIWPEKHQMIPAPEEKALAKKDFSGEARILWSDTHLYVGVQVRDPTPRINPNEGGAIWKGDGVELCAGFPGPTKEEAYGEGFHHIAISPGDAGANPSVWDFQKKTPVEGATAASAESEGGYTIEAAIPLAAFGAKVKAGDVLAFNIHLNNKTSREGDGIDQVLNWNGDRNDWQDPSDWGVAMVLPDPSTKAAPKRIQLFGGQTKLNPSETAIKDPASLTPLPVEYPGKAALLPESLVLSLPFKGTYKIIDGYGFENKGWTHETIANEFSANDFFAIDIGVPKGTPVYAAAPGRIITSGLRGDSYGNYVVVDHGDGYHTIYAHLDSLLYEVDKGEPVVNLKRGDEIGKSGSTGTPWPHLHFGVHKDSRISHSGADVGGITVLPEPLGGYYGLRKGHELTGE